MEVLSPYNPSFNLYTPNEPFIDTNSADSLKCGLCSTEFLLSDIVYFIQHKTKSCKLNHKFNNDTNNHKDDLLKCSNCTESFKTADSLLQHAQFYHNINIFVENNKENVHHEKDSKNETKQTETNKDQIFIDVIPSDSNSIFLDTSKSYNITVSSSNNDTKPEQTKTLIDESTNSSCDSSQLKSKEHKPDDGGKEKLKSKTKQHATFFCDICSASFNQKIHLTKHSAKHTGIKPFKCNECNYSTVERSHLKVHVRVHTGEKPFKCSICEYATAQSSTLKIHKKRHHDKQASQVQEVTSEIENEQKLVEIKKMEFKNLPPTKRFKNISQLENMGKSDEDNKLLGLASIALEREVDTKPPSTNETNKS